MRILRYGRLLAVLVTLIILAGMPAVLAEESATPQPGTPVAATPVAGDALDARLGGSLESFVAEYGEPDFVGDGLVRFDSATVNGIPTILVVYHDSNDQVTRLALVYQGRPAALADTVGIFPTAGIVAPADGTCDLSAASTGFGSEVYPCHSAALEAAFDADQLGALGVTQGEPGDYSIAVDPLPDAYFELIVQPGTDGVLLAPTPVPGEPTAGPTPTLEEQYPPLINPGDLTSGKIEAGMPLSFSGEILTLQVAEFGKQYLLGEDQSLGVSSLFQVRVAGGAGSDQVVFVGFNGDASGLAIGDQVTVYGTSYGTQCFDNAVNDEICQPLVAADLVVER